MRRTATGVCCHAARARCGSRSASHGIMNKLILKPGREKSLKRRHPWVFSGAVAKVQGKPAPGRDRRSPVGHRRVSRRCRLQPGIADRRAGVGLGGARDRRARSSRSASRARSRSAARFSTRAATDAMRLVHGESDGLPGVVADRYGDTRRPAAARARARSAGARRSPMRCAQRPGVQRVWERSDADVRAARGAAAARAAPLRGAREPARVADRRARPPVRGRSRARPQDRLLSRSARQPRCGCASSRAGATCSTASATPAASR